MSACVHRGGRGRSAGCAFRASQAILALSQLAEPGCSAGRRRLALHVRENLAGRISPVGRLHLARPDGVADLRGGPPVGRLDPGRLVGETRSAPRLPSQAPSALRGAGGGRRSRGVSPGHHGHARHGLQLCRRGRDHGGGVFHLVGFSDDRTARPAAWEEHPGWNFVRLRHRDARPRLHRLRQAGLAQIPRADLFRGPVHSQYFRHRLVGARLPFVRS